MSERKFNAVVALGGVLVGGLLGIGGTLLGTLITLDRQEQFARPGKVAIAPIDSPGSSQAVVGRTVEVAGTAEIPSTADRHLWVVVRVDLDGRAVYYPQGRAEPDQEGRWTCVISLGSRDPDEDGPYSVLAVLVNSRTSEAFRAYVRDELPRDSDGMQEYPGEQDLRMASIPLERRLSEQDPALPDDELGTCTG